MIFLGVVGKQKSDTQVKIYQREWIRSNLVIDILMIIYTVNTSSPNVRLILSRFAMKTTVIAKYIPLPSMLHVAPIGNMNIETWQSTLLFSETQRIVTGRVAAL